MQFETLSYQISIQTPHYDEQFYVSQFIRGLKSEIRGLVESQVPQTVERAILLALVQEEVLADAKCWTGKTYQHNRQEAAPARTKQGKPSVKVGNGDFWRATP
jgi:hypothetical protein